MRPRGGHCQAVSPAALRQARRSFGAIQMTLCNTPAKARYSVQQRSSREQKLLPFTPGFNCVPALVKSASRIRREYCRGYCGSPALLGRAGKIRFISPSDQATADRTPALPRHSIRTRAFRIPVDPAPRCGHDCNESAPHPAVSVPLPSRRLTSRAPFQHDRQP